MCELLFDEYIKKELINLDENNRERILKKVLELEKYPELGKHLIGMDIWSLRIGKYWVLYRVKYH
jgi:mRNA-degrading endonuclease RelE of RelBE toxin-antitoxin system